MWLKCVQKLDFNIIQSGQKFGFIKNLHSLIFIVAILFIIYIINIATETNMKKLILIQNDYPSTGKSTIARCFSRYLGQYGVSHQMKTLVDDASNLDHEHCIDSTRLTHLSFMETLEESPITILEVSTGLGEFFHKFYQNHQMGTTLDEADISLSVVLPVTSEGDSFDAVIESAEVFSDHAEYLIAHLITSSYEDDDKVWDRSYAARVMDMFEAVELYIPEIGFQVDMTLRSEHKQLSEVLLGNMPAEDLGKDFVKWHNRVMGQIDSARQYLFGEAFKPTTQPKQADKKSRLKARAA